MNTNEINPAPNYPPNTSPNVRVTTSYWDSGTSHRKLPKPRYFPSSNSLFWNRQWEYEIVKFGTDMEIGSVAKYQRACQLLSLSSYVT